MKNSSLEISDQLYHLKLSKEDFDLTFINQLLKSIQARELFFNFSAYPDSDDEIKGRFHDEDSTIRFDDLNDK